MIYIFIIFDWEFRLKFITKNHNKKSDYDSRIQKIRIQAINFSRNSVKGSVSIILPIFSF